MKYQGNSVKPAALLVIDHPSGQQPRTSASFGSPKITTIKYCFSKRCLETLKDPYLLFKAVGAWVGLIAMIFIV